MELLHPATWHDHDIDFARWLHPAKWHVALESWHWIRQVAAPCSVAVGLGWHAIEFAQTSAILEFYIMVSISPKFYRNRTTLGRKKWRHVDFQDGVSQPSWILWFLWKAQLHLSKLLSFPENRVFEFWCQHPGWQISAILDFRGPVMGSVKCPCTTSCRSSTETIVLIA